MASQELDGIAQILLGIGMPSLIDRFAEENIDSTMVESLSDSELSRLGLDTIGNRYLFRKAVKDKHAPDETSSNTLARQIMTERTQLFRSRSQHRSRTSRQTCITRHSQSARGCTFIFLCLASKDQKMVPTSNEKDVLNKAGLWKKKIRINREDNQQAVYEKIVSEEVNIETGDTLGFPQLCKAGGYELLRSAQNCRELKILDCNWSTINLQKSINPQATIYIRPIQKNLSTRPKPDVINSNDTILQSKCTGCRIEFPIRELRDHMAKCNGRFNLNLQELDDVNDTDESNMPLDPIINEASSSSSNMQEAASVIYYVQADPTGVDDIDIDTPVYMEHPTDTNSNIPSVTMISTVNPTSPAATESHNNVDGGNATSVDANTDSDSSVIGVVKHVVGFCKRNNILNPVEILRKLQLHMITGRPLEVEDVTQCVEGDTNFILVDRANMLSTAFDEIGSITDFRKTLEVQFYNEVGITSRYDYDRPAGCPYLIDGAHLMQDSTLDYGGPRKEFFRLIMMEIKEKYFDDGLRDLLFADYEVVGKVFALSILQNGKLPNFMNPDILQELMSSTVPSMCLTKLRCGLDALGLYEICKQLPSFVHLLQSNSTSLTYRMVTSLLKPQFSEEGGNHNVLEKSIYSVFLRYLREVASGRRDSLTLGNILQFVTGADEEPVLGYRLHPSITFHEADSGFFPTANTCINCLILPRPTYQLKLPEDSRLFGIYDLAFVNSFYGLK